MSEIEPKQHVPRGIEYIDSVSWDEVLRSWKADEDTDSFRREYEDQGYKTWEEWRQNIIAPLHLDKLSWSAYSITNPTETIPTFRGGPFRPWEDLYYGDKKSPTFAEIVNTPDSDVETRDKFADILTATKPIQLIGLLQRNDIFIVEGMHRSTSIALAAKRKVRFEVPVRLFLAESDQTEFKAIP